jgi:exodeoxyribonuclease V alpha subunit
MTALAAALGDSLLRLLPPAAAPMRPLLLELISALTIALEEGELGLNLEADPPEGVTAALWPREHLRAATASGWLQPHASEAPLVVAGPWLRWQRWHQQLQHCLDALSQRAATPLQAAAGCRHPETSVNSTDWQAMDPQQQAAVQAVLKRQLVLLLGGPGTGKTSTVARMLQAALVQQPGLRVQLAAPTGKAAARLGSALAHTDATLAAYPCSTLHRLLEAKGSNRFGRHQQRPLELDLLVVDELSMVDLPLMAALLAALPPSAQLLLVGDAGQLPPVGTGAVLEELCRPEQRARLGAAVIELRTTYRNNGAIAAIAQHLRNSTSRAGGDPLAALRPALSQLQPTDNLRWIEAAPQRLPEAVLAPLRVHQQRLEQLSRSLPWQDGRPQSEAGAALLTELEQLIVLSPLRLGSWGVDGLHRQLLGAAVSGPLERWPLGTPVLNRQNRPEQGLANGDIGVLVERGAERLVWMGGERLLHPARLAGAEPALALTVHKAQGSQYRQVLLLVPPSRHSDPRLLYTGLTRARDQVLLVTARCTP